MTPASPAPTTPPSRSSRLAFLGGLLLAALAARPPGRDRARSELAAVVRLFLVVLRAIPPPVLADGDLTTIASLLLPTGAGLRRAGR